MIPIYIPLHVRFMFLHYLLVSLRSGSSHWKLGILISSLFPRIHFQHYLISIKRKVTLASAALDCLNTRFIRDSSLPPSSLFGKQIVQSCDSFGLDQR